MSKRRLRPLSTVVLPLFVIATAFTAFGVTLLTQPSRWENTPSYANLLDVAPQWIWGALYLAAATAMFASIWWRQVRALAVVAHTAAFILVTSWLVAFVVRYATDTGTTVVNVVHWSILLYLTVQSILQLDEWVEPRFDDRS